MGQHRLTALATMAIENDLLQNPSFDEVIDEFAFLFFQF
jgi:hypothetical protein